MPAKRYLKDKDAKFRLLFEDNPQMMWVVDPETERFLEVNKAAIQCYGYSREEFLNMRVPDIAITCSPVVHTATARQCRHKLKSGSTIDVELAEHPIVFGGQDSQLAIILDVTKRNLLEEQLRQSQKMEAVGMLAGGIAHDFNNLLTIITGYSQLLLNNLAERDPNRAFAEQIMKAGERAAGLTRQLLAFSRRQVLSPKVVDLNALVSGLGVMLRRLIGEDIELHLMLTNEPCRVNADPGQLEQVIMNLVVNARDAMPKGGSLTIETAPTHLDESYRDSHLNVKAGPYVMLAVSDSGVGMDEQTKSRLFEPFFTTKGQGKGTGLGLSTVFGIVKQSGGHIQVYSEPGQGTSFKIYFPSMEGAAPEDHQRREQQTHPGSETILLVEDEEMVRTLVRATLEREGYRVLDASTAMEALDVAKREGNIELLVTDVVMPKMSGRELALKLTAEQPKLKVLYMSGYTDNAIVNNGILDSEMAFIQKPFTPGALARKVREVLEGGEHTRRAGNRAL